jgi:hypothetical protein
MQNDTPVHIPLTFSEAIKKIADNANKKMVQKRTKNSKHCNNILK